MTYRDQPLPLRATGGRKSYSQHCRDRGRAILSAALLMLMAGIICPGDDAAKTVATSPAAGPCLDLFEKAVRSDKDGEVSFDLAAQNIEKAMTAMPQEDARITACCLMMLCKVFSGDTAGAQRAAAKLAHEARQVGHPIPQKNLDAIADKMTAENQLDPQTVVNTLGIPPENQDIVANLIRIAQAHERVNQRHRERRNAAMKTVDAKIAEWCRQEHFPETDFQQVREKLRARYDRRQHLEMRDIDDELMKQSLEILTQ